MIYKKRKVSRPPIERHLDISTFRGLDLATFNANIGLDYTPEANNVLPETLKTVDKRRGVKELFKEF